MTLKTVFIKPRFSGIPLHSLYYEIQKHPPLDYRIVINQPRNISKLSTMASKNRNAIFKTLTYHLNSIPYVIYQLRDNYPIPDDIDLIYAAEHVICSNIPWVVGLEDAEALSGYFNLRYTKGIISKKLKEKSCKKILAYSEWGRRTLQSCFDDKIIDKKTRVVRYTVTPKKIQNKHDDSTIKLLFMGTINPGNLQDFEYKGMYEVVDAFLKLQHDYHDTIQLIIRAKVSNDIRYKIRDNKGIILIENPLSYEEIQNLYKISNIFPQPGYGTITTSVLEAMSYGLPVITLDLFNNSELINDGENGMLLKLPNTKGFYSKNELPNEHSGNFMKAMRRSRPYVTEKLVESIRLLIEDRKLRFQLGNNGRNTIEVGEFSQDRRNYILKEIFDEAIG